MQAFTWSQWFRCNDKTLHSICMSRHSDLHVERPTVYISNSGIFRTVQSVLVTERCH